MKKFYAFSLGAFLSFFPFITKAQSGTDFWFAPPEVTDLHNTPGGEPIYLLVSTFGQAATVTISQPANPGFNGGVPIVVNLNANSTARINLTSFKTMLETEPTNVVLNTGLRVQSTATITCYYEISNTNNTDIFALKGANGLGKEFYIPLHKHAPFFNHTFASPHEAYASFDIVATENNTVVTIYSPVQVDGHPALQQFSVTLNMGQTYSCGWTGLNYQQPSTHPSGAVVIADKPIAVSIKDDSNHNPSGGCYDLTGDQIVPVDILGTEYVAVKGQLNATGDESVIITAVQNNTQIFINGNPIPIATLFAGETYRYDMDNLFGSPAGSSVYITSSKPVYAMHITGFGCEMGQAILPPLNCAGSQQVSFVRSTAETFFLTLLVRSASIGNFSIIGSGTAVINPASFVAVPGTGGQWMAARIQYNTVQIPVDSTFLVTNSTDVFALGIINGGAATGCRYGFFSEFASKIFVDAGPDMLVCANNVVNLNGSVVGGSTTGIWTTTGSGIFTPNNTTLNAVYTPSPADTTIGFIQFTLTSTGNCTPVSDNMMVTFTPAPVVNAGPPSIYSCAKDSVQLMGSVTGGSVTGLWSTSGTGTFFPNAAILNAKYIPSNADTAAGQVTLYLVSTANGNCLPEMDSLILYFTPQIFASAGNDTILCANNATLVLNGNVWGGSNFGQWTTSGTGNFIPNPFQLNATYVPSNGDTTAGIVWLKLTSTNNGGCPSAKDSIKVTIIKAPTADAGVNTTVCANNPNVLLNGIITNSSSAIWTSNGTGTFVPNNISLNATYVPSQADINAGTVKLKLTTTTPTICLPVSDSIIVTITPAPLVFAGNDTSLCVNNLNLQLNGSVTGGTVTGLWTTLGTGNFTPNPNALNAVYHASSQDSANGVVYLILTSTNNGNCLPVSDTIKVTILPAGVANAGNNITICANTTAQLNGSITGAPTGTWSTTGSGGFIPNANTLNAIYVPSPADTTAGFIQLILTANSCNQSKDTITLSFTPAPTANAGSDDDVCANAPNYQLNGAVTIASGGIWSGGSGTYIPNNTVLNPMYIPSQAEINNGFVTLVLTTTGNGTCNPVSDTIVITITPTPVVNAGIDQYVCKFSIQTQLQGIVSGGTTTGLWTTLGSGVFIPNNNILNCFYVYSPSDTANGWVKLVLTSTNNGKCAAVTDTVLITFGPSAFVSAGPDIAVCVTDLQAQLNGFVTGGSTTGKWTTLGSGTFQPNDSALNAIYILSSADSLAGLVQLILESTHNGSCLPGYDTLLITVQQEHIVIAGNDIVACPSTKPISLIGQVINSPGGTWSSTGTGFFVPNNTNLITNYIPSSLDSAIGQFYIVLTSDYNGACNPVSDSIFVNMENTLVADFYYSNACVNQPVNFNDSSYFPNGITNGWQWNFGDGFNSQQEDVTHIYTQTGSYNVMLVVQTDKGCIDTISKTINIFPSPIAAFTTNGNIFEPNQDVKFTNTSTGQSSNWWTFGDGIGTSASTHPIYSYQNEGTYTITLYVSNQFGCTDSVSNDITIKPKEDFVYAPVLPTGFTPNGDGLNDTLFVRGGPFLELNFNIYNEWGERLFNSTDQKIGWDGTYKGKPTQIGIYVYTVDALTLDNIPYKISGEVKLLR